MSWGAGVQHGEWRAGGMHAGLLVKLCAKDNDRVGHCWMAGRLKDGDLAMVMSHSGDCFWTMQLVQHHETLSEYEGRKRVRGYKLIDGSKFGAYVCGEPYEFQPTTREMHLLMAGERIALSAEPAK